MDKRKLHELADEVSKLLERYGVTADTFSVNITVPKEYFDSIKDNFPDRNRQIDFIITHSTERWGISLGYAGLISKEDSNSE